MENIENKELATIDTVKLMYPELPDNHFFNETLKFPRSQYDRGGKFTTPHQIKSIIDYYGISEINPITGRLFTLKECCEKFQLNTSSFLDKVHTYAPVNEYYSHAQVLRADVMQGEMLQEAENRDDDILEYEVKPGIIRKTANSSAVRRSELIIKTKAMVMGHMNRGKYGSEKQQANIHVHGNINNQQNISIDALESMSLDDMLTKKTSLSKLTQ